MTLDHDTHPTAWPADTRAISIPAHHTVVHRFVANPENLPRWAVGFCKTIRRDATSNGWVATTAAGDIAIRFASDERLGVVDFHFSPAPNVEMVAYSRVVPNGDAAEYVFTQLQPPGMPDDVFRAQVRALTEELQVLRAVIAAELACPV